MLREGFSVNRMIVCGVVACMVFAGGVLPAGTLDAEQGAWHAKYKRQANAPNPEDMLINEDAEPNLSEGFRPLFSGSGFGNVAPIETDWDAPVHNASAGAAYYFTDTVSLHGNLMVGNVEARSGTVDANLEKPDRETRYQADLGVKTTMERVGTAALTGFYVVQDEAIALSGTTT